MLVMKKQTEDQKASLRNSTKMILEIIEEQLTAGNCNGYQKGRLITAQKTIARLDKSIK